MAQKRLFDAEGNVDVEALPWTAGPEPMVRIGEFVIPGIVEAEASSGLLIAVHEEDVRQLVEAWPLLAERRSWAMQKVDALTTELYVYLQAASESTALQLVPMQQAQWQEALSHTVLQHDGTVRIVRTQALDIRDPQRHLLRAHMNGFDFPLERHVHERAFPYEPWPIMHDPLSDPFPEAPFEYGSMFSDFQIFAPNPYGQLSPTFSPGVDDYFLQAILELSGELVLGRTAPPPLEETVRAARLDQVPFRLDQVKFAEALGAGRPGDDFSLLTSDRNVGLPALVKQLFEQHSGFPVQEASAESVLEDLAEGTLGVINTALANDAEAIVFLDRSARPLRYLASYFARAFDRTGAGTALELGKHMPRLLSMNAKGLDLNVSDPAATVRQIRRMFEPLASKACTVVVVDDKINTGNTLGEAASYLARAFPMITFIGAEALQHIPEWHRTSGVYGVRAGVLENPTKTVAGCANHDPHPERPPGWFERFRSKTTNPARQDVFNEAFPTPRHINAAPGRAERTRLMEQADDNVAFLRQLRTLAMVMAGSVVVDPSFAAVRPLGPARSAPTVSGPDGL